MLSAVASTQSWRDQRTTMRRKGKITKWKDDQGYGFITPIGGGEQVFVHIKSFSNRHRRPTGNEIVTFEMVSDNKGRLRAEDVAYIGESIGNSSTVSIRGGALLLVPALFLMFVAVSVLVEQLPFVVLGLYLVASTVAFFVYAHDKSAAKGDQWRTPESTLHLLSLLGGWPGALVAQKLLRHKTKKQSFQILFWATVVLNCVGLGWLFSPSGADALQSVLKATGVGR